MIYGFDALFEGIIVKAKRMCHRAGSMHSGQLCRRDPEILGNALAVLTGLAPRLQTAADFFNVKLCRNIRPRDWLFAFHRLSSFALTARRYQKPSKRVMQACRKDTFIQTSKTAAGNSRTRLAVFLVLIV